MYGRRAALYMAAFDGLISYGFLLYADATEDWILHFVAKTAFILTAVLAWLIAITPKRSP